MIIDVMYLCKLAKNHPNNTSFYKDGEQVAYIRFAMAVCVSMRLFEAKEIFYKGGLQRWWSF